MAEAPNSSSSLLNHKDRADGLDTDPWFHTKQLPALSKPVISLFNSYPPTKTLSASLSNSEDPASSPLAQHIIAIRTKAWAVYPWPCIGLYQFVNPNISLSTRYPEIVRRLKEDNHRLLDLGCCVGQDIRRLVADGVPPQQLMGADLDQGFIDLGHELFSDGASSASPVSIEFITGDIFDNSFATTQKGTFDIVNANMFLHIFDLKKQTEAANRIAELLSSKPGSLVVGRQLGSKEGKEEINGLGTWNVFRHNVQTFGDMWKKVGDGKWVVEAKFEKVSIREWPLLSFVVERAA